jgi:hypothetical protein
VLLQYVLHSFEGCWSNCRYRRSRMGCG